VSGTATDVTAVAMLVTPALFKKSLRLTDIGGIIPGLGGSGTNDRAPLEREPFRRATAARLKASRSAASGGGQ
jgi:hypothetical protein